MLGIPNMKNSNVSVKSKGVILFAFNTDTVNYVKIADRAARLVHHTLGLPVTLVTDHNAVTEHIDQTIIVENALSNFRIGYAGGSQWRNGNRYQAYELSPYDETILIDTDYLMLDRTLLTMLDTTVDYRLIYDNQTPDRYMTNHMGPTSLDYVWATAITFKRTEKTKLLFSLVGRIQRNYEYYCKLYNIQHRNFRNDYAFAIANNILNGYTLDKTQAMPLTMLTIENTVTGIELDSNKLIVRQAQSAHVIPKQNVHIIDKDYLLSDNYNKFLEQVCQK